MHRPARFALLLAVIAVAARPCASQPVRQSFDILTGAAGGGHFPIGEVIARVISHPSGLGRCEKPSVCAPAGMIVSARTSEGAVANVAAVNAGVSASGLAQSPVVADAILGRGPFRKQGPQTHIRVMADLFPETVQLVVRPGIAGVRALRGRRVAVGVAGSGCETIATAIFAASGVRPRALLRQSADAGAGLLRDGKVDALFVLSEAPSPLIADLLARDTAKLAAIDGKLRQRLLANVPGLEADAIAAGSYRGVGPIDTVGVRTYWIVNDAAPAATVYGIVRALYNPANRELLAGAARPLSDVRLGAFPGFGALPLHPGAERFYREAGMLGSHAVR